MNDLFLRSLRGEETERFPVWLMRQAGRYLPSYRLIRKQHSLVTLFTREDLIYEITMQPVDQLGVDAAILFSDITLPALSLGLDLTFEEGVGPIIYPEVKRVEDFQCTKKALSFLPNAVRSLRRDLQVPLIGFCGAPFTTACYLMGRKPEKNAKQMVYEDPNCFKRILERVTDASLHFLSLQIDAGVDAVQIFDSWAQLLPRNLYTEFSLPYIDTLVRFAEKKKVPSIVFAKGACNLIEELSSISPTAISFDSQESLHSLRKKVSEKLVIQGNFDPDLLFGSKEVIKSTVKKTLEPLDKKGIIVNLGHGLKPNMDPEYVRYFVQMVKNGFDRNSSRALSETEQANS